MERLKEVLAIVNNKGGVGKTTTAVHLAEALYRRNFNNRILLIDLDSQCNATSLLGEVNKEYTASIYNALANRSPLPIYDSRVKKHSNGGVFVCPGHKYMESISVALQMQRPAEKVLLRCFANEIENHSTTELSPDITEAFDYIIIDCPPQLGDITYNALMVSDTVILATSLDNLSFIGLANSINVVEVCRKEMGKEINARVLITRTEGNKRLAKEYLSYMREQYGEALYSTIIRDCSKVDEAHGITGTLYNYAPKCTTAKDYESLAEEIATNK